jgi:hypothetical protein
MPSQTWKNVFAKLRADRSRRRTVAALALAVGMLARAGARADTTTDRVSDDAKKHFAAGVAFLKDPKAPRYEDAYREFKAAYAASPSPRILGNLGLCALQLERDEEAITAYERYLRENSDVDRDERAQIERDLLTLRAGLVHVRVTTDPPGATIVDTRLGAHGERVVNTYGPASQPLALGVHAGHHILVARLSGYGDAEWEFEAGGGDLGSHALQLKSLAPARVQGPDARPVSRTERPIPTSVVVGAGFTVALGVMTTIVGIGALRRHSAYDSANNGTEVDTADRLRSEGKTLNVATDVLLGVTIVGALTTLALFVSRPSVEVVEQRASSPSDGVIRF